MSVRRALAVLLMFAGGPAGAQVVRGRVTERVTDAPLAGVVLELLGAGPLNTGTRLGSALSARDGSYAIRLSSSGPVTITAKRIGVKRFVSATFQVGEGETVVQNLMIDALSYALPEVTVLGTATCSGDAKEGARIGALWDDVRTALFATQISLRDELFKAWVTRYVRELEPRSRKVLSETRSQATGVVARPFQSAVSAESLSARGYWQPASDGGFIYYGPDADVLLSETFVRDHCFREVRNRRERRGMVGIRFEPVSGRSTADIVGTMWLDERSSELRFVEFGYRPVPAGTDSTTSGGEVHFARLPSGAWIIRKWFIRLPVVARPTAPVSSRPSSAPWVLVRPVTLQLREEGGDVSAEALVLQNSTVSVRGMVRDSSDRPLAGAQVRVAGTRYTTVSSPTGSFTLDSIPFGSWTILAESEGYDALGLVAAESVIELNERSDSRVTLRAINNRLMYQRVCAGDAARYGYGAIRVTVRTAVGDSIVQRLPVALSWMAKRNRSMGIEAGPQTRELLTDSNGRLSMCGLDSGLEIYVVVARPGGGSEPAQLLKVPDRGVVGVVVRLAPGS